MAKVKTSISLDSTVFDYISELAWKETRSVSQQINHILEKFKELDKKGKDE